MPKGVAVCILLGGLAVLPTSAGTPTPPPDAGYDIKAVDIGTTGAPDYIPKFTFQNVGEKPITVTLRFWYKHEGTLVTWKDIPRTRPGQKVVVTGNGSDGGFGRWGAELEVFADCDHALKEKDETNNHLTKTLRVDRMPRP